MSLTDRTNEVIPLSMHPHCPIDGDAGLTVDVDADSSVWPDSWVYLSVTDFAHDSESTRLTLEEAGLLHDRLGLILGRNKPLRSGGSIEPGSRFASGPYAPVVNIRPPGGGGYAGPLEQVLGGLALHAFNDHQPRGMTA